VENNASSPFKAIKIVECGQGIAAAFGAKMLADLGAEVIKVEPPEGDLTRRRGPFPQNEAPSPGAQTRHPFDAPLLRAGSVSPESGRGDPEKSGVFIYLNTNKRGVVIDLKQAEGQQLFFEMLGGADVLLHNVPPTERGATGLESAVLHRRHPRLIVAAISVFGDSGPYSSYKSYELTASNASGWSFLSPGASPYPDLPPLKCFGSQCDFQGGVHAAITILAAYLERLKSGAGQVIEVSEQEAVAAMLEMNFMHYTYAGRETSRLGSRALGPWFIADCADGQIFVLAVEEDQWKRLVEFMGNPEWASEELFKDRLSRAQNMDALKALMTEWLAGWKVQDLYRAAQEHRIPFAPINTMRSLYESEHLRERNFFVDLEQPGLGKLRLPGMPSQYGKSQWAIRRPAPRLGEHNEEVFCGELGLSRERLAQLHQAGVV
jgi:crotonobetainyl-CoA:carnitine CoA-transferase CaiB-like acyl-CoA transferase